MKIKLRGLSYQTAVENQAANALVAQVPKLTWVKYQLTFGKKSFSSGIDDNVNTESKTVT